jgi:hypothetical protein
MRVDARHRREQADEQLLARHLQAEEADRRALLQRGVLGDVHDEAGLPHRGPGRHDDEIARLKAARHAIQVGEARGHAGHEPLLLEQQLDLRHALGDDVLHREEADAGAVLRDGEDRLFRLVEDDVRIVLRLVGAGADALRR